MENLGLWLPDWLRDVAPIAPVLPAFFWRGCGCCKEDPVECCEGVCFEFTIAGVTDDECGKCDNLNGTWTLVAVDPGGLACLYQSTESAQYETGVNCVTQTGYWWLHREPTGAWKLSFGRFEDFQSFPQVRYELSGDAPPFVFDCDGDNEFSLTGSVSFGCKTFPDPVTLTAVSCE